MNKKWLIFSVLVAGIFGVLILTQPKQAAIDLTGINTGAVISANGQNGQIGDHIIGDANAKVVLVVYGNYQCSACSSHNPSLIELAKSYNSNFAMVYRHFPSPQFPNARAAAAAAEAAGKQGKFWEMHNKLFQNYLYWSGDVNQRDQIFQSYANELGLNLEQFKQDIVSSDIKQKIDFDTALGKAHNLTETPTLVLNGEKLSIETWSDEIKLKEAIKHQLDSNK